MIARARSPLPWLGGLLALYLLAPIAAFVVRLGGGVSASPGLGAALWTSLFTATVSATVIAILGTPLAYLLAHGRGPVARVLTVLVPLPLAIPPLMSGLLLLYVVGPYTAAGRLFGGRLTDTRVGIILAQVFVAAPFLIVAARSAFAAADPALEDVAATLGHGRVSRFWRVALPGALPAVAAGLLLAWLRSFGEFGATVILAYHPYSLPVFTFVQFDATGLPATMLPIAAALAAALVLLCLSQLPIAAPRRRRGTPAVARARSPRASAALDFALNQRLGSFSLDVAHRASGPRLALLGASGAGKTLTLRLLAGLTPTRHGHVRLGGRVLDSLPPERRLVGYVPQHSALLPRRDVWRQVTFGTRAEPGLAAWWLERLGLQGLEARYPHELSGGQQRRVALARALATDPEVLLLDEPFTGLDAPVRDRLRRELRRLQRESGLSTVIVTHDPEEAALLADEIVVLDDGRVLQAGGRGAVFREPASPQIARLLGIANTHDGRVVGRDRVRSGDVEIDVPTGALAEGANVAWCIRPEQVTLESRGYAATLVDDVDLGATRELAVRLRGSLELTQRTSAAAVPPVGADVHVQLPREQISLWPLPRDGESCDPDAGRWHGD